jgi:hypothetical protein
MSMVDAFLAPVMTEVLLNALSRLRTEGPPAGLWIGSPWLADVPLFPGIFAGSFPFLLPGVDALEVASLLDFLKTWRKNEGQVTLLVQGYDPLDTPLKNRSDANERELRLLEHCLEARMEVLFGRSFQGRFIVAPDVVLSGSASIPYPGLDKNRDHLTLHTRSSSPQDYATALTVCENHLITARHLGACLPPRSNAGLATHTSLREIRRCYSNSWR